MRATSLFLAFAITIAVAASIAGVVSTSDTSATAGAAPDTTATSGAASTSDTDDRPSLRLPPRPRTVEQVLASIGSIARAKYRPACTRAGIPWPPARMMLLGFKREKLLEVWGAGTSGQYKRLATYKVLASSGHAGPKRRQGDRQVPEGFYHITELNPNSDFHLSFKVDYPNADDIANAAVAPGDMGGDIYIHGNRMSIGCLALGDEAIEELFPLVAQVPEPGRRIIIAPFDFRRHPREAYPKEEPWVHRLYDSIAKELKAFPAGK